MGDTNFSQVLYGKETTRGTPVAATRMLLAKPLQVKPDGKPVYPKETIGVRAESYRSYINQNLYQDTLSVENGYFQCLPFFLGCGVKGATAGAEVTPAQGDYPWAFGPSMTGANSPFAFTLQFGDDTQAYRVAYAMFERIKLSWTINQSVESSDVAIEGDFFARKKSTTTFTPAIAAPIVTPLNGKLSRLYVDTTWAGIGSTELTNILRSASIEILTGVHPDFSGSASKDFNTHKESVFSVMITLTLEDTAAVEALRVAHDDPQTFQAIRVQLNGPQIGTGTNHKLNIDVGGTWEAVTPKASSDRGNNLATAVFHGFYDGTGAKLFDVNLTTNQNTI